MRRTLSIIVAAIILAACSPPSEDGFVGTWHDLDEDATVQFFAGGAMIVENRGVKLRGRYVVLDEERLRLELTGNAGSDPVARVVSYKLSGDRLALTTPDGDSTTMARTDD